MINLKRKELYWEKHINFSSLGITFFLSENVESNTFSLNEALRQTWFVREESRESQIFKSYIEDLF